MNPTVRKALMISSIVFTIVILAIALPLVILGAQSHDNYLQSLDYTETSCTLFGGTILETTNYDQYNYRTNTYWTVSVNVTFIYNEQILPGYLERNSKKTRLTDPALTFISASIPTSAEAAQILSSVKNGTVEPCVYQNDNVYPQGFTDLFSTNPFSSDESIFVPYVTAGSVFLGAALACIILLIYAFSQRR